MTVLAYKISIINFKNFVIKNLGLAPDPDWILVQQKPESGFRDTEALPKIK
jgi:hypothetical protein